MIISIEQAKALIDLADWKDEKIKMKLKAVEQTIRAYTNNNFQVLDIGFGHQSQMVFWCLNLLFLFLSVTPSK